MKGRRTLLISVLIVVLISVLLLPTTSSSYYIEEVKRGSTCSFSKYPIMRPDSETLREWLECYNCAPHADINLGLEPPKGSLSLLNHLKYTPVERDQGSCGNCWAWAGTGVLEICLDVNEGILDRLSIQYLNSKYNGGTGSNWACCGGWLEYLADFYVSEGFAIPWSNTNADWTDGTQTCASGTQVPWQTISTSLNYSITTCTAESVQAHNVGQTTAINNIKNVLAQDKAIWFGFFLPTGADWSQFFSFWNNQPEDDVWNPDYSCGHFWGDGGGGHAVLCVGYNDDDPQNSYWIMVNSWGTTPGRPNGIFHLDMNMNYDCFFYDPWSYYSFYWQTLDVTFDIETITYTVNLESQQDTGSTTHLGTLTFDGTSYNLPNNVSKTAGTYSAEYFANDGYVFNHWETTGLVSVSNVTANPANVTVSGDGSLKALYEEVTEPVSTPYTLANFSILFINNPDVRIIYPSNIDEDKPLGCSPAWVSDWLASAFVYTKLGNVSEGLDTHSNLVNQTTGNPVGDSGVGIISSGGPVVNVPVYYYEVNKIAPVIWCGTPGANGPDEPWSQWYLANGTAITETAIEKNESLDLFVIEVFEDSEGRFVFLAYGVGWKGTYAAGKYFDKVVYPNLDSYTHSWVTVKWEDTDGNGFVNGPDDGDTYTLLASGDAELNE